MSLLRTLKDEFATGANVHGFWLSCLMRLSLMSDVAGLRRGVDDISVHTTQSLLQSYIFIAATKAVKKDVYVLLYYISFLFFTLLMMILVLL